MVPRAKKQAVLLQLSQETDAVSLQELLEKLGDSFSQRSVRRWLAEMVKEGVVERLGEKKGTRYKFIQRMNRHVDTISSCFSFHSKKTIMQVQRPIYERAPITYADEWIELYQPNISFYIPLEYRQKLYHVGKRSKREDPAGTYAHQIFNRLLIDLSYNSSRLEGNTYSLLDTQKLILEGSEAEGKLDEEKIMILNHKEAIRYLVDSAFKLEVNLQTIYTLHYLLSDSLVEARYAGKIRDQAVRIGGSTYIPFEHSEPLQIRLSRILEKADCIEDPYEQSFFLLIHITYLQPFLDVNKRTARLSANIPMIRENLVPLSFNDVERNDYISAMIAIYELQDIRPLLDLYIFSYMRTCAAYDSTVKVLGFDAVRVRYRKERRGIIRAVIQKCLLGKTMDEYVLEQTFQLVKKEDQSAFLEDVKEDLKEIDQSYIVGLGVTLDQLQHWMDVRSAKCKM
jgi:Fic family protein